MSASGITARSSIPWRVASTRTAWRCCTRSAAATGQASPIPGFAKYIFPGGYCPALSEVLPPVETSGLIATDIEVLRLHYAETLRHWRRRFAANRDTIASLYDERFCRMFEFYLCGAEIAFRREGHMVFQVQLARHQTAVPLTRDYITAFEAVADRQKSSVMSQEE